MGVLQQLVLIVWKGGLMRKRHFIVTGFEVLIPLLAVILFTVLRSSIGSVKSMSSSYLDPSLKYNNATFYDAQLIGKLSTLHPPRTLFVPKTDMARNIVANARKKLFNEDINTTGNDTLIGFDTEDELLVFYLKENFNNYGRMDLIGVVFNNFKNELPDKLDYKLRMVGYFNTQLKYPPYQQEGPVSTYMDEYKNTDFWFWQTAIDDAFIQLKTEKTHINPVRYLQRYPYPDYITTQMGMSFLLVIPYVFVYGLSVLVPVFVKRIVDEKANRAKELMRMMGLNDFVYFTGIFLNTFFLLFVIACIASILFSINFVPDCAVLDYTDGFLFFIILTLYMVNALLFLMAVSTFFNRGVLGAIVSFMVWCASHSVPTSLLDPMGNNAKYSGLKLGAKLGTCLLPNCAIHWASKIMGQYESNREGASWSNMNKPGTPDDDLTLSMVMGMMVASCFVYAFITWYVDNVWPWQFGIPKHPAYLFMPSYWFPNRTQIKGSYSTSIDEYPVDVKYFEEEPENQNCGIMLKSLSKIFGSGAGRKVAVDSVSLSMFEGQITVLLGHNGAGKTTTMNVLTGLYVPSSGTAIINGFDILEATKQARRSLGLCPQHNVLYDNLTVEEHLKFFAGLKGLGFGQMPTEVNGVLEMLDLVPKRNTLSTALSGGMKRKLSLGIAIIGGSKVLVLDEPTSGMDPQARRAVWDLLQRIRSERTVLLTTHYMEEADVLGDRIAIMAEGKVQCAGSPLFLKRKFGAGYNLKFSKGEYFKTDNVTSVIKGFIPDAILNTETTREACYILPTNDSEPFADMFDEIERNKTDLDFNSFGLSITTMEDVFLKVGNLSEKALETDGAKSGPEIPDNIENDARESIIIKNPLTGPLLLLSRFQGLLLKRFHDAKRYPTFLIFQLLIPIVVSILMLFIIQQVESGLSRSDKTPLTLNVGEMFGKSIGFFTGDDVTFKNKLKNALTETDVSASENYDMISTVLKVGKNKLVDFKQNYLVSVAMKTIDPTHVNLTSVYNGEALHLGAMSLNVMSNAFLRFLTGNDKTGIRTTNHPLPDTRINQSNDGSTSIAIRILYSVLFPSALSFLSASFVLLPIHERVTKSKLLQRMTGLSGITFWAVHFIWDYVMFVIAALALLVSFFLMKRDTFGTGDGALGSLFLLLLLYGWCAIPFNYILSFKGKKPTSGFIFASSISSVTGLMLTLAITLYRLLGKDPGSADKLAFLFRLFPDFSVTWGASNIHTTAVANNYCHTLDPLILNNFCEFLAAKDPTNSIIMCCPAQCGNNCIKYEEYISWKPTACGRDMLFMALTGCLYFAILILLETNFVKLWYNFKTNILPRIMKSGQNQTGDNPLLLFNNQALIQEDGDVADERTRVETVCEGNQISSEALVVYNLTKQFTNLLAVDHLTFALHKDECFGLLGVNGAGKTTTFSMLTGDLMIGDGNAFIGPYNVRDHLKPFQRSLGYCPQFDALLDRMTGREALYLFARLRGMPTSEIARSVDNIIHMVDLQDHADKTAEKYSGGNRRKLSLALSLIGGPSVVFLDEPTAGVDPAARRKIWNTFTRVQNIGGMSFILTTHSMEECEALCARLAIMVNGRFRCLGSIQHLKSKFGQGYTVILKLQKEKAFSPEHANKVRNHLESNFNNIHLKDEHQGLLHYHIPDKSIPWSVLFREMERAKKIFQLEDYLVSDTTLEQIFLAFAKTQRLTAE